MESQIVFYLYRLRFQEMCRVRMIFSKLGDMENIMTGPTHCKIWKGPMNRGLNFLILVALSIPVVGVIFKNTWSPS